MYKVEVIKKCGCFTKSGLAPEYEFDTLDAAQTKAHDLVTKFNEEFCAKHRFKTEHNGNVIKVIEDEDY